MSKKLRNLALLGGLGAAAMMMGSKKKGEDDVDTTADASAGRAKDRLGGAGFDRGGKDTTGDASAGQTTDTLEALEKARKARKGTADSGAVRTPGREAPAASAASAPTATDTGDDRSRLMRRAGVSVTNPMTKETSVRDYGERIDPRFVNSMTYGRREEMRMKKGGVVKSSASKRADGCAIKGKTRGRMV